MMEDGESKTAEEQKASLIAMDLLRVSAARSQLSTLIYSSNHDKIINIINNLICLSVITTADALKCNQYNQQ